MTRIEFELNESYKGMMILMFFFSAIVFILGKLGKKSVTSKKAEITHRNLKKSICMLVPFLMIILGLKREGHKMMKIMEFFKNNKEGEMTPVMVPEIIDPEFNDDMLPTLKSENVFDG